MKIALMMVVGIMLLTGCGGYTSYSSTRSLDLSPARVAKGGSVCVVTMAKINRTYPDAREARWAAQAEAAFRNKGFTIAELPPGANYIFLSVRNLSEEPATSATVTSAGVYLDRKFTHKVGAKFFSAKPDGRPDALLWDGLGIATGMGADWERAHDVLLTGLLDLFPN